MPLTKGITTPNAGIRITLNPTSFSLDDTVGAIFLIGLLLILIACFSSLIPF
jgi:hypothetical protein